MSGPSTGSIYPTIALAIEGPACASPELPVRNIAFQEMRGATALGVFCARRILGEARGLTVFRPTSAPSLVNEIRIDAGKCPVFIDGGDLSPSSVRRGKAIAEGRAVAVENFRALAMAQSAHAGAVCFTPFDKPPVVRGAMTRLGDPTPELGLR